LHTFICTISCEEIPCRGTYLYTPPGSFNTENIEDEVFIEGPWRKEVQAYTGIYGFPRTPRSGKEDTTIWDILTNYFMNEGDVPGKTRTYKYVSVLYRTNLVIYLCGYK
jgi:hypothetical protein